MAQQKGNPGRTGFRWKKDPVHMDSHGEPVHMHRMSRPNGETAWMKMVNANPPVYHAEIRREDGTHIASIWIHCRLAAAKEEVEKRAASA